MKLSLAATGLMFGYMSHLAGPYAMGILALMALVFIVGGMMNWTKDKYDNGDTSHAPLIMSLFSPMIFGIFLSNTVLLDKITQQTEGISCNER